MKVEDHGVVNVAGNCVSIIYERGFSSIYGRISGSAVLG
jgi:hypothetical protein